MRGAVMHGPGDVRVEEREEPRIVEPTDAIIRVSAACVCGSDLWPYRGIEDRSVGPAPMGHEYVGDRRGGRRRGHRRQARPVRGRLLLGLGQHLRDLPRRLPERLRATASRWARSARRPSCCASRWPTAPSSPRPDMPVRRPDPEPAGGRPTCWAPAGSAPSPPRPARARRSPSSGDGAVGLLARAGRQAARRRADHRHEPPRVAPAPGPRVRRHRHRRGARRRGRRRGSRSSPTGSAPHSVVEAVGTQESMIQAIHAARPGGHVGFVGVAHGVAVDGHGHCSGSRRAPARRARTGAPLPARADRPRSGTGKIDPGKVFVDSRACHASHGGRTSRLPRMRGRIELVSNHRHKRPANADLLMGDTGLEPVTSALSRRRSPS